ncbi:MAG: HAD-IA family hydrolase [Gammaproteobacteria bacterium]|nr:HAD-IA family hydrolase [Gammaproteobacteria bacterium]
MSITTVLFDLDGTLADTAPDLAYALNQTLEQHGRAPLPFERIRPIVSHGGRALIELGFGYTPEHPDYERVRLQLLQIYLQNIARMTSLFPGMSELLMTLESSGYKWGIVTNKPGWLTGPLMEALQLNHRAATIVSSDTTSKAKPHPEPMYYACKECGSESAQCVYVGDAERDIVAGRAAGMRTVVALFGYISEQDRPLEWGADALISQPLELIEYLAKWRQ